MTNQKKKKAVVVQEGQYKMVPRPVMGETFKKDSMTALLMKAGRKPLTLAQQIQQQNMLREMMSHEPTAEQVEQEERELMAMFEQGEETVLTPSELRALVDQHAPIIQAKRQQLAKEELARKKAAEGFPPQKPAVKPAKNEKKEDEIED